jgi:amino acid adenylation domain-containing protein
MTQRDMGATAGEARQAAGAASRQERRLQRLALTHGSSSIVCQFRAETNAAALRQGLHAQCEALWPGASSPLAADYDEALNRVTLTAPAERLDSSSLLQVAASLSHALDASAAPIVAADRLNPSDYRTWQASLDDMTAIWSRTEENAGGAERLQIEGGSATAGGQSWIGRRLEGAEAATLRGLYEADDACAESFMLAAWQIVLWRAAGEKPVRLGLAHPGRPLTELESCLGPLAWVAGAPFGPGAGMRFEEWRCDLETMLRDVRALDVPDESMVSAQPWPFGFEYLPLSAAPCFCDVLEAIGGGVEPHALCLTAAKTPRGWLLTLAFDKTRFTVETAERLLDRLVAVLSWAAHDRKSVIDRAPRCGADERQRLMGLAGETVSSNWSDWSSRVFDVGVARPDHIAVVAGGVQLTYRDLCEHAASVAAELRRVGVGRGACVGHYFQRSADAIVGMLAILRTGAAYAPIDPATPATRAWTLLEMINARWLLGSDALLASAPAGLSVLAASTWLDFPPAPDEPPEIDPSDLAYVLFTSGSTGAPKPVAVEHRNLANYIQAVSRRLELGDCATFATVSTLAADLGNTVVMPALAQGGTLHVLDDRAVLDPDVFARYLTDHTIDCLKIVPLHLQLLLGSDMAALPAKRLVFGGDVLPWDLVQRIAIRDNGPRIANHYGPTETTVGVLAGFLSDQTPRDGGSAPLGSPLDNTQVYVLDRDMEPTPFGGVGELYVAGAGCSRGYFGQPGMTADRFVPVPADRPGGRMYRTGDLVRVNPNGALTFVGREDGVEKIRGRRIDTHEVAELLRAHPDIADAVVRPYRTSFDDLALAGYIVPAPDVIARASARLERERIDDWREVFATTHAEVGGLADEAFNAHGWLSSYTGEPLPSRAIREQAEGVAYKLAPYRPRRILEIGCGNGHIMRALAGACERYVGVDFSREMLDAAARLAKSAGWDERVSLHQLTAAELGDLPETAFDLVVMNSVIQYFPTLMYLEGVLRAAVDMLLPGGRIFVGDVRDYRLQSLFNISTAVFRATSESTGAEISSAARLQSALERELIVDPEYFYGLVDKVPRISGVETTLKAGADCNELTMFRYDVVLHTGNAPALSPTWTPYSSAALERLFGADGVTAIAGVPNARLTAPAALVAQLSTSEGTIAAKGTLLQTAERLADKRGGLHLHSLIERASAGGKHLRAFPSMQNVDAMDLVILPEADAMRPVRIDRGQVVRPTAVASYPLAASIADELAPRLRERLLQSLPPYMVPSTYIVVEAMPVGANGKLALDALPAIPADGLARRTRYVPPQGPIENLVCEVWAQVLRVSRIGANDDFFDLGGHSLLATQVTARLRDRLGISLELRHFFEGEATVRRLAQAIGCYFDTEEDAASALSGSSKDTLGSEVAAQDAVSFAEERLLLEADPANPAFNIPFAFSLKGELDADLITRTFAVIASRHDIWRTSYARVGDTFVRRVVTPGSLPIRCIDLLDRSEADALAAASQLASEMAGTRFDLGEAPLARVALIAVRRDLHVMIVVVHHIISDGWSTALFCDEFARIFSQLALGIAPTDPAGQTTYATLAARQRARLDGPRVEALLDLWVERLGSDLPELALPFDSPPGPTQSRRGSSIAVSLGADVSGALADLARAHGASLFMVLIAIYAATLARVTDANRIVTGSPVANRRDTAQETVLGCFINFVVLSVDVDDDPSFVALLKRVRAHCLWAFEQQDAPFGRLISRMGKRTDGPRPPLIQALFELANTPGDSTLRLPGLTLAEVPFEHGTSEFELNLILRQGPQGLAGWLIYRTDLFREATAWRIFRLYEEIASMVTADPSLPLSQLPSGRT